MAFLGKLLVMLHAVLSIGMLTWAVGVYTQRIKWKSADKEDPGVFDRQQVKQDALKDAMNRAYFRWTGNYGSVVIFENERSPRRDYYAARLKEVESGTADPSVIVLATDPATGFLNVRGGQRVPVKSPGGTNLKSIAGYEIDIKKTYEDITASQKENTAALAARALINNEITGVTKPKVSKGLRQQINEQKLIEDEANLEIIYIEGFTTIREAEFGLLKKRKDALDVRTAELKKFLDGKGLTGTGN